VDWFVVELEIFLYGKEFQYIKSTDQETAVITAIRKTTKKYGCNKESILVISCKKTRT
tara:strand:- start:253 stop:426 length:174 start_codon:yes stop_codon:yes gene_type:complete